MMDEQKFQAFKRRAVEENEKRYGAEIRQTYGDQEMDQANASVMGLTQEQYRQWESLGQEIRSKLRQAVEMGDAPSGEKGEELAALHRRWLTISGNHYDVDRHKGLAELYVADERFTAIWQPSEACEPYQDEEGRLLHRPLAEHVVNRISGQPAIVTSYNDKRESESAPLPFSLSALQIEAAKRFGLSAQNVLDICQKLYETHKLITYPRSDCRYLPEEHFAGRHAVMNAISVHAPDLLPQPVVDPDIRNRCWDDKKVDAHHAIIPTARSSAINLTENEAKVYNLSLIHI